MDVRLPDGRIVKNVPEGTTQAELTARLNKAEAPAETPQQATEGLLSDRQGYGGRFIPKEAQAAWIALGKAGSEIYGAGNNLRRWLGAPDAQPETAFEDPGSQAAYAQLEQEFPIATTIGREAPTAFLPGGLPTQVAYSAAIPLMRGQGVAQSAMDAGVTAGLGGAFRLYQRLANAGVGRFGQETAEGVMKPAFGEGMLGRAAERAEQQASARIAGAGPRAAIERQNQDAINRRVAEWLGQDGPKPDIGEAFNASQRLYRQAGQTARPVKVDADFVEEIKDIGIRDVNKVLRQAAKRGDDLTPAELESIRNDIAAVVPKMGGDVLGKNAASVLRDVESLMEDAGFDADTLKEARTAYRKWATLSERRVVDIDGNVSEAKLENAITLGKGTKRAAQKGRLAEEDMALRRMSKDIQDVKKSARTSMTPERSAQDAILSILGYDLFGLPGAAAAFMAPGIVSRGLLGQAGTDAATPIVAGAAARVLGPDVE